MDKQKNLTEISNHTAPEEKKRVSDVINWERDIEPYRIIEITAGVGSGKNYWVENDLMMKPQGKNHEYKRVLLITSRKSKVRETFNRTGLVQAINLSQYEPERIGEIWGEIKARQGCCVCNNWHIEYYVKNIFKHDDESTHLWKYFDVIVVDEAHSLATDATFCDAPFHVLSFLKIVYSISNVRIIMMTATPDPIKGLITLKNKTLYHKMDLKTQCINVQPSEVIYATQAQAIERMITKYKESPDGKWHIVYFATRTTTIIKKILKELKEANIPDEKIAVSYSRYDEKTTFSETIHDNKTRTEEYLAKHEKLPENIRIFLSTSRNKEGINIDNPDCQWIVMIESQWADEIEQMCGRVRTVRNDNQYYLIYDAPQHESVDYEKTIDYMFEKKEIMALQETFDTWCNTHNITKQWRYEEPAVKNLIDSLEDKKLTYLRYNVFLGKFKMYYGKLNGQRNYFECRNHYAAFREEQLNHIYVTPPTPPPVPIPYYFLNNYELHHYVNEFICQHHYLDEDVYISPSESNAFLDYLSLKGIKTKSGSKYKNLGNALSRFGYKLKEISHKKEHPLYNYKKIVVAKRTETSISEGEIGEPAI